MPPSDEMENDPPCMAQMVQVYSRYKCSVIGVERVPEDQVEKYGIIDGRQVDDRLFQIANLVEKPPRNEAPSNLGIVGRYILHPSVMETLENLPPGSGGEIQPRRGWCQRTRASSPTRVRASRA